MIDDGTKAENMPDDERRQFGAVLDCNKLILSRMTMLDTRLGEMIDRIFGAAPRAVEGIPTDPVPDGMLGEFQTTHERTMANLVSVEDMLARIESAV